MILEVSSDQATFEGKFLFWETSFWGTKEPFEIIVWRKEMMCYIMQTAKGSSLDENHSQISMYKELNDRKFSRNNLLKIHIKEEDIKDDSQGTLNTVHF